MKLGIANLLLAVNAVAELGTAGGDVFKDNKVTVTDAVYVGEFMTALKDAGAVNYSQLIPEAGDLDEEERTQLVAAFKAKFKLANHESVESVLEQGFEILSYGMQAIQALAQLWKIFGPKAVA